MDTGAVCCPNCVTVIDAEASRCQHCGYVFNDKETETMPPSASARAL